MKHIALINVPMPIVTPRLRLVAAHPDFAQQHIDAISESLDEFKKWFVWAKDPEVVSLDTRRAWLAEAQGKFILRQNLFMCAFEKETGRLVAGTGFHALDWTIPSMEIGYWVRQSAMGKGYATEFSIALLRYAFLALGANRVAIKCDDSNIASRRVIEKTGIPYEGTTRNESFLPDGSLTSVRTYAATHIDQVPEMPVIWGDETAA